MFIEGWRGAYSSLLPPPSLSASGARKICTRTPLSLRQFRCASSSSVGLCEKRSGDGSGALEKVERREKRDDGNGTDRGEGDTRRGGNKTKKC